MANPESLGPVHPVEKPLPAESAAGHIKAKDSRSVSSLSKSQQEDVMQVLLAYAYQPILIPPNWDASVNVSIQGIISAVEIKIGEIGVKIWNEYIKHLKEMAEEIKEQINSPQYLQSVAWTEKVIQQNQILIAALSDYVERHQDQAEATPFITMAIVVAGGMIGNSINVVNTAASPLVAAKPIVDASQIASQVLAAPFVDPSVMLINLMLPAMLYSTAFFVTNAGGAGQKQIDLEFARLFAKNIMQKVNNNEIGQFLLAMLAGEAVTKEQLAHATAVTKLIMLSVAFALFYKVETGWLTGQEFAEFVKNNPYKPGTIEYDLIEMIQRHLSRMQAKLSAATLEHLLAYFDSNPDFDELLSPEKIFSKIYPPFKGQIDAA